MSTTHHGRAFPVIAVAHIVTVVNVAQRVSAATCTPPGRVRGGWSRRRACPSAADHLGRRRIFLLGLTVFTGLSPACGLAGNDTRTVVMRGVQGADSGGAHQARLTATGGPMLLV
ncbi:hypothetical protein [Streptomyces sp. NPDC126522]|uniref:hypothetical protein n=1 Tax=Streptomyces sp. NPDC126522 TaxID=3155211 RepID=UPI003329BFC6